MDIFNTDAKKGGGKYILSEDSLNLINEMNTMMDGLTLEDLQVLTEGRFKFPIYTADSYMKIDIEEVGLTTRANNCLRRSKINTVDDLIERINTEKDLFTIKNLGAKTAKEIMFGIFLYQFSNLTEKEKHGYMRRVMELNGIVKLAA